jgi:hypothetical protein
MSSLAECYAGGDRIAVWNELHACGSLRGDAQRDDARAVALQTMKRAAHNVATIHRRLIALGYIFDEPRRAHVRPNSGIARTRRALERTVGPLPPALDAWFREVGYVFFRGHPRAWTGSHPWHDELLDPIEFIYSRSEIALQREIRDEHRDKEPPSTSQAYFDAAVDFFPPESFELVFAGDFFHKNEVSGGGPTVALLPAGTADVRVLEDNGAAYTDFVDSRPGDDNGIWFVDYLRRYFERGGFRRMRPDHTYPPEFWPGLAQGLLDI